MAPDLASTRLGDAHVPPAGIPRDLWARIVSAGATEWAGYQCGPAIVTPDGHAAAVLRGVIAELGPELPAVLRIVAAARAFREAAGARTDFLAPWGEMAALCAAVDGVPYPPESPAGEVLPEVCSACHHWSPHTASGGCGAEVKHRPRCGCTARNDDVIGQVA